MGMASRIKNLLIGGDKRTSVVKKNVLGSLLIKGVSVLISLAFVPLTLGYVSSAIYGIWLTISSMVIWLNFFDVGFTLGLKNKLAEAIAVEDWERGRKLVSTTYAMMVFIFVPLFFILVIIIPLLDWASILNVGAEHNEDIKRAMGVLVGCFCLQMIVNILTVVVSAFQMVALSSLFPVIGHAISLVVIYILTKTCPPSLTVLSLSISLVPVLIVIVASWIMYNKRFKQIAPSIKKIDRACVGDLFNLGYKFFIIQIQVVVFTQSANFLISNISGPNDVTTYSIASQYLGVTMMLYSIILTPLWPAFTEAFAKNDYGWMNRIYQKLVQLYWICLATVVVMVLASPIVYKLWIGDRAIIPYSMTIIVALYMLIQSWERLQVTIINGIGYVGLQSKVTLLGLFLHIPLSYGLGHFIGGYGVICSMIIINTVYAIVFTTQTRLVLANKATGIWIK